MDSGALVPDEIIIEMMVDEIKKAPKEGFVLDGFPRTVDQAKELDKALTLNGERIDIVLNLEVDDQVIARRLTGRRSCPKCGAVYHIENLTPKVEGICDNDGTELVKRADDSPEVVANRLKTYHLQTVPVVGYYRSSSTVLDVDGDRDADETSGLVFEKLNTLVKV